MDTLTFTINTDTNEVLCQGVMDKGTEHEHAMTPGVLKDDAAANARFLLSEICGLVADNAYRLEDTSWTL